MMSVGSFAFLFLSAFVLKVLIGPLEILDCADLSNLLLAGIINTFQGFNHNLQMRHPKIVDVFMVVFKFP